jgi:hypothetical protein
MQPDPAGGDTGNGSRSGRQNRLIYEKSPYLLQHAGNPVDWYPWGDEAFARAAEEQKPVFLSIGYSTCHWCHVMAHESFEDPFVASLLNESFICIKVDREERPDIDSVYMAVCQMMTGQGGWPLTIVMTPDKKPFFAATYIPKERRFSMSGLVDLLPRITSVWQNQREDLLRSAETITSALQPQDPDTKCSIPITSLPEEGFGELELQFDPQNGGFGNAPKFPSPHTLLFLLRYWARTGTPDARSMAEKTLDAMQGGGICDQLGGGFHRYSTDAKWNVPHFEKMLYDQALLLMAYTEAYQATRRQSYRETAEAIIAYVLRDLLSPEGAFYSGEDADSPGGEGRFYLWTVAEMEQVLGPEDGPIASLVYGATTEGNFQSPEHGRGMNILSRAVPADLLAVSLGLERPDMETRLASIRQRLFSARLDRPRPSRDGKILADWNGLIIAALAQASRAFDEPRYLDTARDAMEFVLSRMHDSPGGLFHRYLSGDAGIPGFAADYASVILALIELYETTFEIRFLSSAIELNRTLVTRFWDREKGGFFTTPDNSEPLILRGKEIHDGAYPSCNSIAFLNLLRLSRLTGDPGYEKMASGLSSSFINSVARSPSAHAFFLCALDLATGPSQEVVLAGEPGSPDMQDMVTALRANYLPAVTVLTLPPGESGAAVSDIVPFTRDLVMVDGKATAYICSGQRCSIPVTDPGEMLRKLLAGKKGRQE